MYKKASHGSSFSITSNTSMKSNHKQVLEEAKSKARGERDESSEVRSDSGTKKKKSDMAALPSDGDTYLDQARS